MPVIIVAYSGGYLPAAYSLAYGGAGDRVRGVVLLDALYGEPDKFARWIEPNRGHAFFVSAYSALVESRERRDCRRGWSATACRPSTGLPDSLRPGVVAFVDAGDVSHEDFVSDAWTGDPAHRRADARQPLKRCRRQWPEGFVISHISPSQTG